MYPPVEPCRIKRSVKGSASSGSTNMRTDSDTPSSDMGPPATPRDGMSMNPIIRPPGIAMTTGTTNRTGGYRRPNSPPYYDGSEQFDTDEYAEPESEPIPTRLVTQTRTTIVEQNYKIPSGKARAVNSFKTSVETKSFEPVGIAELPASPVGRRITRDLVHQGMGAPSTTGDVESSTSSRSVADHMETTHHTQEGATTCRMVDESSDSAMPPAESEETQHSNMSQTNSGLLESSTIDFAVRYSIPAMTGSGHLNDNMIGPEIVPAAPGSSEKNTDSGISDLLAGYQHTDTKQEDGGIPETEANHKRGAMANSDSERVSSHAQQSSDEQSFKSCTDVLESASPDLVKDAASVGEPVQIISPEPQLPAKDSDARSVQTCNDMEISGRTNSMPPSRLPSSNLDVEFQQHKRPTTGSSSPFRGLRRALGTRRESGFSFSSKLRRNSKRDMNQDSISISGSSSTLSNLQSPAVPPRESSASKEAQRHKAVGSYLIRKAYLPLGKSRKLPSGEEDLAVKSSMETSTDDHEPHGENLISTEDSPFPQILNDIAATEQMLVKQDVHPERQSRNNVVECHSSSRDLRVGLMLVPTVHHHPFSSPVADIPEPSSVYSLQDLSLKCLTHSSPAGVPMSPEHNQRDSLSTTHLSWGGRKPYGVPSTSASEPRLALPSVQEDTTTDLRLPVYKYNPPQRYLHDLKEDSHEDSSLNTSASNLKNSQIRFPYSAGFDVRTSVDDAGMLGRKSYMCSRRASIIEDIRGLPFLEFSEANLYDKFKNALPNDMRFSRASGRALLDVRDVVEGSPESGKSKKAYHTVNGAGRDGILRHSAQSSGVINMSMLRRRYSSKKLIAEIDQVSIPSITQLTQRVGEMFPSLSLVGHREQDKSVDDIVEFPEEQGIMEHAMEEIHHVHPSSQKRSSARLRPMRGSSALMVVDDDVYEEITSKEGGCGSMSDQCVGALDFEVEVGEAGTRAKGKGKLTTRTPTRQLSIVTELQTPSPDVLRLENCTTQDRGHRTSAESTLSSSTGSPGSFVSTPTSTETRPWNSDKNYPWAITTNPAADISLPPQAGLKQSPRPGPSHLRNVLSDATSSTFTCLRTSTTPPHGKVSGFNANRQSHRLSIFGRSGDQAHAVGERYPTSALSPPTAIFRDHLSTCDTSDDEDFTTSRKSNKLTLSKRFSSAARGNTLTYTTPRIVRSKVNPAELASPASGHENSSSTLQDRIGEARAFTSNRHTFRDAQGMPIGAYHRHRIVDSIKRWWHKGEDLIRTISRRSSNRRDVVPGGN
jgi:serine/arginine repetitive matrix protein 2